MRSIAVIFLCFPLLVTFAQDLRDLDSIARFFNDSEIEKLIELENKFTNFVIKDKSDTIAAYSDFLNELIVELDKYGYYSNEVIGLVDFTKLNLEDELKSSSVYDKIFCDSDARSGPIDNPKLQTFCAINLDGTWVDFIRYFHGINDLEIWPDYIRALELSGTFPRFLGTLPFYRDLLDFNNQVHRLVVMIHFINHSSKDYF